MDSLLELGLSYIPLVAIGLIIIFVLWLVFRKRRRLNSHWQHHFDGFQYSAIDFYNKIVEEIKTRDISEVSFSQKAFLEGSVFGAKRKYLRICRKDNIIDVGAAAFGNGFFVSWWIGENESDFWSRIPVINTLLGKNKARLTYYQIDTKLMFQELVHSVILSVVDEITVKAGIHPLSELQRQPKSGR